MMREILFRGKRMDNGEWIVGHLLRYEDGRARINPSYTDVFCYENDRCTIQTVAHEVDAETVGQFTGLTDKNGEKIFERDIVKTNKFNTPNKLYVIKFDLLLGAFIGEATGTMYFTTFDGDSDDFEIIGNIHDNPELLED